MRSNIEKNSLYRYKPYQLPESLPLLSIKDPVFQNDSETFEYHNCSEFLFCRKPVQIIIDSSSYDMQPGDVCFIAPFQMHRISSAEDHACHLIAWDLRALLQDFFTETYSFQNLMEQLIKHKKNVIHAASSPRISRLISLLVEHADADSNEKVVCPDPYLIKGLLLAFWIELNRAMELITDDYNLMFKRRELFDIHPALVYIHEYYQRQISTEHLASLFNMSPSQFRVIFKNRLHQTPHEYINNMRLEYSCRLLLETDLHILPISLSCGFNSLSSYNRCFHARYGTSPTQWKAEH